MNPNETIVRSTATGKEIEEIVTAMEPILTGKQSSHVMMACLSLAIIIQHPDISVEHLIKGVKGASEWIALYLSEDIEDPNTPTINTKVN